MVYQSRNLTQVRSPVLSKVKVKASSLLIKSSWGSDELNIAERGKCGSTGRLSTKVLMGLKCYKV